MLHIVSSAFKHSHITKESENISFIENCAPVNQMFTWQPFKYVEEPLQTSYAGETLLLKTLSIYCILYKPTSDVIL